MAKRVYVTTDEGAVVPKYATVGSAGCDLYANLELEPVIKENAMYNKSGKTIIIKSLGRVLIKTGLKMQIPEGFELDIRPRSGISLKQGLMIANSPGTIDSDYRGDIGVILINVSAKPVSIKHGDRIAQAILMPYEKIQFRTVDTLEETDRGEGGFGHTGVNDTDAEKGTDS